MSNKSEATWHPNGGPEVPHADLIARLRSVNDHMENNTLGVRLHVVDDAIAALGDTVPREQYDDLFRTSAAGIAHYAGIERERDEARAERDALAHVIEHAREWMRTTPATQLDNPRWLELDGILDAPALSLALHDAEVKAQALEELREAWNNDWSDVFDVDEQVGNAEAVGDWIDASAAATIRSEAK